MRDPSGELPHRFHFVRLPQQSFGFQPGLLLGFELPGAFLDAFLERLGERPQLNEAALYLCYIGTDAYDPGRLAAIVEDDVARFHPAQRLIASPDDPELGIPLGRPFGKRILDEMNDPRHILLEEALEPALVTTVEFGEAIERKQLGREADRARLYVPFEKPELPCLLGKAQKFLGILSRWRHLRVFDQLDFGFQLFRPFAGVCPNARYPSPQATASHRPLP